MGDRAAVLLGMPASRFLRKKYGFPPCGTYIPVNAASLMSGKRRVFFSSPPIGGDQRPEPPALRRPPSPVMNLERDGEYERENFAHTP